MWPRKQLPAAMSPQSSTRESMQPPTKSPILFMTSPMILPALSPAYYLDHDDHTPPSFQWQSWSIDPFVHGPRCLLYWVNPYLRQRNFFSCSTLIYCHKLNKCIPTSIISGKNTIFMQRLSFLLEYRQIYCNARNYLMQHNKFVAILFTTRNHIEFCANNPYLLQRK